MKVIVLMHEIWELGYNVSKKVNLFAKWTITNNYTLYEVYITVQERWTWFLWQVIIALISMCRHLSAPKRQHCQVTYVVVTLLFILAFVYLYTYISQMRRNGRWISSRIMVIGIRKMEKIPTQKRMPPKSLTKSSTRHMYKFCSTSTM